MPVEWTRNPVTFPTEPTVVDLFREQVRLRPAASAAQAGERIVTYRELNQAANRIAQHLLRLGLHREDTVAVYLPASIEFLAAILGVLKAGGTYFPVATDIPEKRLDYLLADSQSRWILSDETGQQRLTAHAEKVLVAAELLRTESETAEPVTSPAPSDRAYITYTSGSTGQPKGVEIEHRALTNFVHCCQQRFRITPQDRAAMLAYVSFDASVGDIWPALSFGGTLVVPPEGILHEPDGLVKWLTHEKLTLAFVSTGLVEIILPRPWPANMALRFMITGGDRLRVRPPQGLSFALINGYGPTENTVFSTWSEVLPEDGSKQPPPIGRPLANTTAYVLDDHLQPVPIGTAGELYVGGVQVARGYLGQPELTRQKFVPDPFAATPGARMYRTGDWARWLPSGEIDFIGRKDGQIQIRGRRVELGEIEAAISAHPGVRQICCVPWLDDGMPAAVIAHVVPHASSADLAGELRSYLQPLLPDYMVPSKFVTHAALPLTPQGKLNRAALIALQTARPAAETTAAKDDDPLEQKLSRLWHTLLPAAADAPRDATFQVLGGDSLLAMKLLLGVEDLIGRSLNLTDFLVRPTLDGLCQLVLSQTSDGGRQMILKLREGGKRPPLFILHGHTGDLEVGVHLAETLGEDQPIYGIRSSARWDQTKIPDSIEAAAAAALPLIRQVQPDGAITLIGYSWAGTMGFEIARQIWKQTGRPCLLVAIGTEAPIPSLGMVYRTRHFLRHFPGWFGKLLADKGNRRRRLARWREMVSDTAETVGQDGFEIPGWIKSPFSLHMVSLLKPYRPWPKTNIQLVLIRETEEIKTEPHPLYALERAYLPDSGWNEWTVNPVQVHWARGNHETILQPPVVREVAKIIRAAHDQFLADGGTIK